MRSKRQYNVNEVKIWQRVLQARTIAHAKPLRQERPWSLKEHEEGHCGMAGLRLPQGPAREVNFPDVKFNEFGAYSKCSGKPNLT